MTIGMPFDYGPGSLTNDSPVKAVYVPSTSHKSTTAACGDNLESKAVVPKERALPPSQTMIAKVLTDARDQTPTPDTPGASTKSTIFISLIRLV